MISYVLVTRDRPDDLARTLTAIGSLPAHGDAEVIVVDNRSRFLPTPPKTLPNGVRVRLELRPSNEGAAGRNIGVTKASAESDWIVMLDDDSDPTDTAFVDALANQPEDVAAVMADIHLPALDRREVGGLPEVFVGCGVAIRRDVFLELHGYDPRFGYYAEEYDLAARMILAGYRIAFEPTFRVDHHKSLVGRDMNGLVHKLTRNNAWVMQRYAPEVVRRSQLRAVRKRCRDIARLENARAGYASGLVDLRATIRSEICSPMTTEQFDRFTGLAAAQDAIGRARSVESFDSARIIERGKNAWVVEQALRECGVEILERDAEVDVIGTMSPGPMLDAYSKASKGEVRTIMPWVIRRAMRGSGGAAA